MKKGLKIGIATTILSIVLIASVFVVLINTGLISQSVLSISPVAVERGDNVYWVYTGSANNLNEKVTFIGRKPSNYETNDGTEIRPQKGLEVSISKKQNSCIYRVDKQTITKFFFFDWEYYILNNPEREALIDVTSEDNQKATIDGTVVDSVTFRDNDGRGEVTLETQGILAGKVDCANYENVALYDDGGGIRFVNRNDLENRISSFNILGGLTSWLNTIQDEVRTNSQFVSSFTNIGFDGKKVEGLLNFGNVVFTITADQEYFDSVVYTPPKITDPRIDDILIPDAIKADGTATMRVIISNRDSGTEGNILVTAQSDSASITPSSTNVLLRNNVEVNFNIKVDNRVKNNQDLTVEVCSKSQFGGENCDRETVSFDIIADTPDEFCGDNICQASESKTSCAVDCLDPIPPIGGDECKPLVTLFGKTIIPNIFCIINNFIEEFRLVFSIGTGIIGTISSFLISLRTTRNLKFIRSKHKVIIALIVAISGGVLIGILAYIYFWLAMVLIVLLIAVRLIVR